MKYQLMFFAELVFLLSTSFCGGNKSLCGFYLQNSPIRDAGGNSLSLSAEAGTGQTLSANEMRIWCFSKGTTWEQFLHQKLIPCLYTSDGQFFDSTEFTSNLYYTDVPISVTRYVFAVRTESGSVIEGSRSVVLDGSANGYLQVFETSDAQKTIEATTVKYSKFFENLLTPQCTNKILEGYFLNTSSVRNGFGAYKLIENNVLRSYSGGDSALKNVAHWTINESGENEQLSAYDKICRLKKAYGKDDTWADPFGGLIGFTVGLSLLFLTLIIGVWFSVRHLHKKDIKKPA